MEPRILIIGRSIIIINILMQELQKFGRNVMGAADRPDIQRMLQFHNPDFIVIGNDLPDQERDELLVYLLNIKSNLKVHLAEKQAKPSPYDLVGFTNKKAVEWKIEQKLGKQL